eukprot:2560963-Prymnesium_polylepis.1
MIELDPPQLPVRRHSRSQTQHLDVFGRMVCGPLWPAAEARGQSHPWPACACPLHECAVRHGFVRMDACAQKAESCARSESRVRLLMCLFL